MASERAKKAARRMKVNRLRADPRMDDVAVVLNAEPTYEEIKVAEAWEEAFGLPDILDRFAAQQAGLRGLIAECLALNPIVSGDMEKVRVWADVVARMRKAAAAGEAQ